jgi:hypothetical protein
MLSILFAQAPPAMPPAEMTTFQFWLLMAPIIFGFLSSMAALVVGVITAAHSKEAATAAKAATVAAEDAGVSSKAAVVAIKEVAVKADAVHAAVTEMDTLRRETSAARTAAADRLEQLQHEG